MSCASYVFMIFVAHTHAKRVINNRILFCDSQTRLHKNQLNESTKSRKSRFSFQPIRNAIPVCASLSLRVRMRLLFKPMKTAFSESILDS